MLKRFENYIREDDPYNEEEWDDIEVGDKLICIDDFGSSLKEGDEYVCVKSRIDEDDMIQYIDVINSKGKVFSFWSTDRFKKKN